MQDLTFDEQYQTFQRSGYAADTSSNIIMGDVNMYKKELVAGTAAAVGKKDKNKKRKHIESSIVLDEEDDDEDAGPWAVYKEEDGGAVAEETKRMKLAAAAKKKAAEEEKAAAEEGDNSDDDDVAAADGPSNIHIQEPDREDEKWEKVNERKISYVLPPRPARGTGVMEAKSTFHGTDLVDYQGRSWNTAPSSLKPDGGAHECYIPKRCARKLTGHTKGVQALEFIPETGHLLLSASMDGKCKIWDMQSDYHVRRTFMGHSEAVRAINMSNTGSHFISSGFDRLIRHWDVETGQATGTFSNRKMAYSVKFYPRDNNLFIAACNDNKVYQWDVRTGEVCQEYNHHLQPCNTVTFIDEGRKFVSTSDDKKILVWEFDIPVPIKYIAEPNMHCIPAVSMHPSGQFFAGQSMDNTIVVYSCSEGRVKQMGKKLFKGHNNSGYACQIGFSPNGKFLVSGDGLGQLHFWDWKTTKTYRKFHAHDNGPCMAAAWHPLSPAKVATCGWDGVIKVWDS